MRCAVFYFYPMEYVIRKQKTDIRNQKTEIRRQKTDIRNQKSDIEAVGCHLPESECSTAARSFFISPDGSVPEYARE